MAGRKQLVTNARELDVLAQLFRALRSAPRLCLLEALRDQPKCVTDLAREVEMPQSNVSTHLRRLADAGLVKAVQTGRWRHYQVASSRVLQIVELAQTIIGDRRRTEASLPDVNGTTENG